MLHANIGKQCLLTCKRHIRWERWLYLFCGIAIKLNLYFLVLGRQQQWGHSGRPQGNSIHTGHSGFYCKRGRETEGGRQQRNQPEACRTEATSASEGESIKVTTTCATTYNVDNPSASSYSEQTTTKTFDASTGFEANSNIATFYFIPTDEAQDVDVVFHLLKQTIQNISLAANTHVTLQGDLSENNTKWGATKEYAEKQIKHFFYKDNGEQKGTSSNGRYYFYLPKSEIEKLESVIGAIFHKEVEIRLDKLTVFDETLGDDFNLCIMYNKSGVPEYLAIYVNDGPLCSIAYTDDSTYGYDNFSIVSNELNNNPTE